MREKSLTVGRLARDAGISPQILRHYERLGLLRPRRTASGYRVYADEDRARLDAIRTLRELDVDLATIGRVLRGATGLRATAELHVNTLEHQARLIQRRVAVLRASLRLSGELDAPRIQRLHALARLERAEKARFIADQLGKRMANSAPPALQRAIIDAAAPIAHRWAQGLARQRGRTDVRAFAKELSREAESGRYDKEQRFWMLLAILKPRMATHPAFVVGPWLMRALRRHVIGNETRR